MLDSEQEIIRVEKLKKLKELFPNIYPYRFEKKNNTEELRTNKKIGCAANIAGRIMSIRCHGKATFMDLYDSYGKIQLYFNKSLTKKYEIINLLDIGDIIGVFGELFETHTKELTIGVKEWELLAKSLHPLPEKWHKIEDEEIKHRKRWLDLMTNPANKNVFIKRAEIINKIREFLNSLNFIEVDTPILQPIYGGAFANPFKCYYKALDEERYLRISDELYLKRIIIGGFEKVYEFCKDFRNEGMDRLHNPEFTQLELYQAYADYNDMMNLVESIFDMLTDGKEIEYQNMKVKFNRPWKRITFFDALKEYTKIDFKDKSEEEIISFAEKNNIKVLHYYTKGKILEEIFESFVSQNLIEPTFVIDYPKDISPLAKTHREDNTLVERFEPYVFGIEIGNAFSELNDPIEQMERFKEQQRLRQLGDETSHPIDEDFIEAMIYGMPPTGGLGLGIDRIVMILTNTYSIKDVILFPPVKRIK